jgi:hypothetical protein
MTYGAVYIIQEKVNTIAFYGQTESKRPHRPFPLLTFHPYSGIFKKWDFPTIQVMNFFLLERIMAEKLLQEYDAKLDNKSRCIIHGKGYFDRYHVKVYNSGKIEMTPRVLAGPEELSAKTLRMIYSSAKSLKEGTAGSAVDFKRYKKYLKDKE